MQWGLLPGSFGSRFWRHASRPIVQPRGSRGLGSTGTQRWQARHVVRAIQLDRTLEWRVNRPEGAATTRPVVTRWGVVSRTRCGENGCPPSPPKGPSDALEVALAVGLDGRRMCGAGSRPRRDESRRGDRRPEQQRRHSSAQEQRRDGGQDRLEWRDGPKDRRECGRQRQDRQQRGDERETCLERGYELEDQRELRDERQGREPISPVRGLRAWSAPTRTERPAGTTREDGQADPPKQLGLDRQEQQH